MDYSKSQSVSASRKMHTGTFLTTKSSPGSFASKLVRTSAALSTALIASRDIECVEKGVRGTDEKGCSSIHL